MRTSADRFDIMNPATGEAEGSTLMADGAVVDEAVGHAERVAREFADMPADARAAILNKTADLMEQRVEEMSRLLTREQGKPVYDNTKEILFGAEVLRYYAAESVRMHGSLRVSASPHIKNIVSYHPVGVTAAIVPWNYPIDLYCWKIGPAIATGCPMIVKSPHETPLAMSMLVDCLH